MRTKKSDSPAKDAKGFTRRSKAAGTAKSDGANAGDLRLHQRLAREGSVAQDSGSHPK